MKFFKNKKGFTLVELVVVIAILGILAGIAIPRFMDATATARGAKIVADMRTIESAVSMSYAKTGAYVTTLENLVSYGYLASSPKPPVGNYTIAESGKTGTTTDSSVYTLAATDAVADDPSTPADESKAATAYGVKLDGVLLQTLLTK